MAEPTPAEQLESFKAIREIAALLVSAANSYADLTAAVINPERFDEARDQALATAITTAQVQNAALESLQELRANIDSPYHPPLSAILAFGSISTSCMLIASANTIENLSDVPLLRVESLQRIINNKSVDKWLRVCLGAGVEPEPG